MGASSVQSGQLVPPDYLPHLTNELAEPTYRVGQEPRYDHPSRAVTAGLYATSLCGHSEGHMGTETGKSAVRDVTCASVVVRASVVLVELARRPENVRRRVIITLSSSGVRVACNRADSLQLGKRSLKSEVPAYTRGTAPERSK